MAAGQRLAGPVEELSELFVMKYAFITSSQNSELRPYKTIKVVSSEVTIDVAQKPKKHFSLRRLSSVGINSAKIYPQ